jgi:hypothetical protein
LDNTTERQREYKARMYRAGFKQTIVWVKRKEEKQPVKLSFTEFVKQLRKITSGMKEEKLNKLLKMFIKIAKSRKEEEKLRKNK